MSLTSGIAVIEAPMPAGPGAAADPTDLLGVDLDVLVDIVAGLARVPDLWRSLVVHDSVQRGKVRLLGTADYEVWLLGWCPGQRVELHDHGDSAAAFVVVEGDLVELRADHSGELHRVELARNAPRTAPRGTIHDVINVAGGVATSIHAYSPPLTAMGFYPEGVGGRVRTEAVAHVPPRLDPPGLARQLHPAGLRAPI
jgi:mannose-6-phosphate isomerase-like protein (cupin superfamily)